MIELGFLWVFHLYILLILLLFNDAMDLRFKAFGNVLISSESANPTFKIMVQQKRG